MTIGEPSESGYKPADHAQYAEFERRATVALLILLSEREGRSVTITKDEFESLSGKSSLHLIYNPVADTITAQIKEAIPDHLSGVVYSRDEEITP